MNPPTFSNPPLSFCAPGAWPWDDWQRMALEAGLSPELAALGRSLMREADQHAWCARLRAECGWNDAGRALLARLLARPRRAAARLHWLYATDGLRCDPWQHRGYYEDSPCWKALRRRWDREQARLAAAAPAASFNPQPSSFQNHAAHP